VDAVGLMENPNVLAAWEEKHSPKLAPGSYELDIEQMTNIEFKKLMEHVKDCSEKGIVSKKFTYTTKDVQDMVTWYHGAQPRLSIYYLALLLHLLYAIV
jgi:hypothetical protein